MRFYTTSTDENLGNAIDAANRDTSVGRSHEIDRRIAIATAQALVEIRDILKAAK